MSENKGNFYITTPIYYPNGELHIGNAYCTVVTDVMARYKKARGFDVFFQTGLDENSQNVAKAAENAGLDPYVYLDAICGRIKNLWKLLDCDYDYFLRTTDGLHVKAVQKIFKRLFEQGDIYKGFYEGFYCRPCESFFTERNLKDGKCPDCGRDVESIREDAYFMKMSKYSDRLLKHIADHPEFIKPDFRRNEMVKFIEQGLEDLCVTRSSLKWGIPVDFAPGHVVYVWLDALTNYINSLGYGTPDDALFQKYWNGGEVMHIVGKEINRFHTIIWPIVLMALGEKLPERVYAHGWLTSGGQKISKSLGNGIYPDYLAEKYGVDAVRYFLLRGVVFGNDGDFTEQALIGRINSDLANDFGNLLSRTVGMIDKYFGGVLPAEQEGAAIDDELINLAKTTVESVEAAMDDMRFSYALSDLWEFVRRANKYTDENAPWVLAKDETKKPRLAAVLYNLAEALRVTSIMIAPVMPNTPALVWRQLNIPEGELTTWDSVRRWGASPKNVKITKGEVIFPRIEAEKPEAAAKAEKPAPKKAAEPVADMAEIGIEDFAKIEIRVGEVLSCAVVEGSDKLLCSQVSIGGETRQIVSGIAKSYSPDEMTGKKVLVVTNLKPVKLRGVLSAGMLLCASNPDGSLKLATVEDGAAVGSVVK